MECHVPQTLVCLWPRWLSLTATLDWSLVATMVNLGRTPCRTRVWPRWGGEKRGDLVLKDHDLYWTLYLFWLPWGTGMSDMGDHCYHVWMDTPLAYFLPFLNPLGFPDTIINKLKYLRCLCGLLAIETNCKRLLKWVKRPFLSLKAWWSSLVILILLTDFLYVI